LPHVYQVRLRGKERPVVAIAAGIIRHLAETPQDRIDLLAAVTLIEAAAGFERVEYPDGRVTTTWPDGHVSCRRISVAAADLLSHCSCGGRSGKWCVHYWASMVVGAILHHGLADVSVGPTTTR